MGRSDNDERIESASSQALTEDEFLAIVERTPLVSIDLVPVNPDRRILIGKRTNEPAKGSWFVPGGRIRKGEALDDAFARIAEAELGKGEWLRENAEFLGVFTHCYDTNFAEAEGVSTHYVVLAYAVEVEKDIVDGAGREQHSDYMWRSPGDLNRGGHKFGVHANTVAYADEVDRLLTDEQYEVANARKDALNWQLWQTPALTMTGLAFVFTVLLMTTSWQARWIAAILAVVISFAAIQLLRKHRFFEVNLSITLEHHEERLGLAPLNRRLKPPGGLDKIRAVHLWQGLFGFFIVVALAAAVILTIYPPVNPAADSGQPDDTPQSLVYRSPETLGR